MNNLFKKTFALFLFLFLSNLLLNGQQKPTGLMTDLIEHTEYVYKNGLLSNLSLSQLPAGEKAVQYAEIRSTHPTLGWIVPHAQEATIQTAYHIVLSDSYQSASDEKDAIWDSKLTASNQSVSVRYGGKELLPNTTYFWKVKTITNHTIESDWSDIKTFRTSDSLTEYGVSHYPLVKSVEYPQTIKSIDTHNTFVDFGKASFGTLRLTLTAMTNADTITLHLGEHQQQGRVDRKPGGTIRYRSYKQPLLPGTHTYHIQIAKDNTNTRAAAILMPAYVGEVLPFRYCEIEGYSKPIAATDVMRESVHYPFDESQSFFECSNDTLNQIWDLCKYSIKATSFCGIYVDGDRERIPYEADALINQLCHYGVDREYSMARRTHEYLLKYPTWPTEWIMQSVLIAWYDYLYTGDARSLQSNYEILRARSLRQLKDDNGLISTKTGLATDEFHSSIRFGGQIRDIVDWPHTGILGLNKHEGGEADGFEFTDYNVVVNAYHYEAIKTMSKIAEVLDMTADVKLYQAEMKSFEDIFFKSFFDRKKGYFVDGIHSNHSSLHGNMFATAFGLVPNKHKQSVMDFIESRGMACSVYGSQFLMDALYEAHNAEYGLSMLTKTDDRSWYNMIRVGSTISLEAWDNKYKPNQDWNHAWGAAPANIIPRKLVGLEPLAPGFSLARLRPQIGSLSWLASTIPTIRGTVNVDIKHVGKRYEMRVSIPANMSVEVYLPLLSKQYKVRCNDKMVKGKTMKNEPFVSLGSVPSGDYIFTMEYQ